MSTPTVEPRISGLAYRVSILAGEQAEAYTDVFVTLDADFQVVHVFSSDRRTHFLTIPLARILIEWSDPAELQPQLRLPWGARNLEHLGDQMRQMLDGMSP